MFRGKVPELLRHPAGAHVVDDLYAAADARQRSAMAAEFYGKEYALFEGGTVNGLQGPPARLGDLLRSVDPAKRRAVLQDLAKALVPIMEKGLVDSQIVHRWGGRWGAGAGARGRGPGGGAWVRGPGGEGWDAAAGRRRLGGPASAAGS